jgi:hypothetical protein
MRLETRLRKVKRSSLPTGPRRLARSLQTDSAFTTCTGMCGSGWRTANIPTTEVRRPTDRSAEEATSWSNFFALDAAGPGSAGIDQSTSAQHTAMVADALIAIALWASELPERFDTSLTQPPSRSGSASRGSSTVIWEWWVSDHDVTGKNTCPYAIKQAATSFRTAGKGIGSVPDQKFKRHSDYFPPICLQNCRSIESRLPHTLRPLSLVIPARP